MSYFSYFFFVQRTPHNNLNQSKNSKKSYPPLQKRFSFGWIFNFLLQQQQLAHIWQHFDSIVPMPHFVSYLHSPSMFFQLLVALAALATALSGPVAGGLCYTACNAGYVSCLAAVGVTAGVTAPVTWYGWFYGVPAACAGCSLIQGACMAACTPLLVAPTP